MTKQIFDVDKEGLAKLLTRRGIEFAALELIQNALDENVTTVEVELRCERAGLWTLSVIDDNPEGFADLSHAYTLFAESKKKGNAEKRGRFNLGEKLVIAIARKTVISTTTGTIIFDEKGRRNGGFSRLEGTKIDTTLRMTRDDVEKILRAVHSLIVPENVVVTLQVEDEPPTRVGSREMMKDFTATLPTEIADAEGYLRPTERKTRVEVYKPREGEKATLYEMGIPVVETGDAWHVNVMQKVPLNSDRDNVTPSYLRRLRTEVLNECIDRIEPEQARAGWVNDVLTDKDVTPETVNTVLTHRYGDKRVIRDPSDPESTKIAMSQGFAIIEPGTFSKAAWGNIRSTGAALPSGQVTPSPKPYSEDGKDLTVLDPKDYTKGVRIVVSYAKRLGCALLGANRIFVTVAKEAKWPYAATFSYKGYDLTLNMGRLGKDWFENPDLDRINQLLLHEYAHFYSPDHLSSDYHEALCHLGAKLGRLALDQPAMFRLEE